MTPPPRPDQPRLLVRDGAGIALARQRHLDGDPALRPAVDTLRAEVADALAAGPFTIVHKTRLPPSGDPHDYQSVGPYWWPNPETPDGLPYIRRDGERNPEWNDYDPPKLTAMVRTVETLALARYFFDDLACGEHAARLLRVFLLDEATRMNPHLEFGQAIPGRCTGRGIGIIDTSSLATILIDAILLLDASAALPVADRQGLQRWFGDYLRWLLTSSHGHDEAATANNHATAYDLQVAVFALYVGDGPLAAATLNAVPARRFATQIEPDGRQPHELARTKAFSYSSSNLSLGFGLASVAAKLGIDLWTFATADGRGLRRALDWLVPYWTQEKPWTWQEIEPYSYERAVPLLRQAARAYDEPTYEDALRQLPLPETARHQHRANLCYPPPLWPGVR